MDDAAKKLSIPPQAIHSPVILGEAATDKVVQSTQSCFIRREDKTIISVTMRQKTHEASALLSDVASTSFDEPINPLVQKNPVSYQVFLVDCH